MLRGTPHPKGSAAVFTHAHGVCELSSLGGSSAPLHCTPGLLRKLQLVTAHSWLCPSLYASKSSRANWSSSFQKQSWSGIYWIALHRLRTGVWLSLRKSLETSGSRRVLSCPRAEFTPYFSRCSSVFMANDGQSSLQCL